MRQTRIVLVSVATLLMGSTGCSMVKGLKGESPAPPGKGTPTGQPVPNPAGESSRASGKGTGKGTEEAAAIAVGDRVLADYQGKGWLWVAEVTAMGADGITVRFLDGTSETRPAAQVERMSWKVGTVVRCESQGGSGEGPITEIETTITIKLPSGETPWFSYQNCRSKSATAAAAEAARAKRIADARRVLARTSDRMNAAWFPAKVLDEQAAESTVWFEGVDSAISSRESAVPKARLKPFDWGAGSKLSCASREDGGATAAVLVTVAGDTLEVEFADTTASASDKVMKVPVGWCRQDPIIPPEEQWKLSSLFGPFDTYALIKRMPAAVGDRSVASQTSAALDYEMQAWDGAQYVKIKKCVATSKFEDLSSGDEHTARYATTACAVELARDKCLVLYAGCYQEHQGYGRYAACQYRARSMQDPSRISCKGL